MVTLILSVIFLKNGTVGNNLKMRINQNLLVETVICYNWSVKQVSVFAERIIIENVALILIQLTCFADTIHNFKIVTFHQQH